MTSNVIIYIIYIMVIDWYRKGFQQISEGQKWQRNFNILLDLNERLTLDTIAVISISNFTFQKRVRGKIATFSTCKI